MKDFNEIPIEAILEHRYNTNPATGRILLKTLEFLVKWMGHPSEDNSWGHFTGHSSSDDLPSLIQNGFEEQESLNEKNSSEIYENLLFLCLFVIIICSMSVLLHILTRNSIHQLEQSNPLEIIDCILLYTSNISLLSICNWMN
jgi:hypothetical protein